MIENYEKFLSDIDDILAFLFEQQRDKIKCKKGCSLCCEKGEYPYSYIEFAYLTQGYIKLPDNIKILVQQNIKKIKEEKEKNKKERFEHKCPFLINNECCVYDYRGIVCRTFGLCYYDDKNRYVRLPECVKFGLNYSQYYEEKENILKIENIPKINLRIDRVLNSNLAKKHKIKCGEIRPMMEWLNN